MSESVLIQDLEALARATAAEAADLILTMRREAVDVAGTKSSATDVVTKADLASEKLIRERILAARPEDGFIGEEGDNIPSVSGVTWVVDPIDGTVNYLYGIPFYAVSIAAQIDGQTVVGVVNAPELTREYRAARGEGAFLNDVAINVPEPPPLSSALVATGFGYEATVREAQAKATAQMLPQVRDIRRMGSCALDICAVAEGSVDAYVETGPALWDYAAASLIADEAGAQFGTVPGINGRDVLLCASRFGFTEFSEMALACGFALA